MMKLFLGIVVAFQLFGTSALVLAQAGTPDPKAKPTPCEEWTPKAKEGEVCTDLIEGIPCAVLDNSECTESNCAKTGSKRDADGNIVFGNHICFSVITQSGLDGIQSYVAMIYRYASWAIVTLAVLFLIIAGIQISLGGASAEQKSAATKRIFQIIGGLVLFFMIGVILRTINPTFFS